jgi:hypothetical protein
MNASEMRLSCANWIIAVFWEIPLPFTTLTQSIPSDFRLTLCLIDEKGDFRFSWNLAAHLQGRH